MKVDAGCRVAEHAVQVGSRDRQARSGASPNLVQVDVGQRPPSVVPEDLAIDLEAAISHQGADAKRIEGAMCIARQINAGPDVGPMVGLFDDLDVRAGASQRDADAQPG